MTGEGLPILLDLVDLGVIRIVDLVFVNRGADGSLDLIEVGDIDHDGQFDFALFAGYRQACSTRVILPMPRR